MLKLWIVPKESDSKIDFQIGNPKVEIIKGELHLYRTNSDELNVFGYYLCILSLPSHLCSVELLEFVSDFLPNIKQIRLLQDPKLERYMALLEFVKVEYTQQFYTAKSDALFSVLEQDRCKMVVVESVHIVNHKEDIQMVNDSTQVPSCAVCLERLDLKGPVLTTLCNHTFHCDCLYQIENSKCPVCRYSQGTVSSICQVCSTTDHLWICLICGHVGCGRYSNEHAKAHYQETMHTYSLELETQRVWDYAGDGYVHRLILNKQDGKFVEFPHPDVMTTGERSLMPSTSRDEKLENLAVEYNHLLTSQLEEQRNYYEKLLMEANASPEMVEIIEKQNRELKKKNTNLESRVIYLDQELNFVRELNTSLLKNQNSWKTQVENAKEAVRLAKEETQAKVLDLEGQVRDLMFYLDTQKKIEASPHKQELQDGRVQVVKQPTIPKKTKSKKHKK